MNSNWPGNKVRRSKGIDVPDGRVAREKCAFCPCWKYYATRFKPDNSPLIGCQQAVLGIENVVQSFLYDTIRRHSTFALH